MGYLANGCYTSLDTQILACNSDYILMLTLTLYYGLHPNYLYLQSPMHEGPVPVLRDAPKIKVGIGILREILAGSGILFHRGKWD
jgi:hypothetical protein